MATKRWRRPQPMRNARTLTPGLRRYLESGDFGALEPDLALYRVARRVLDGHLEELAELWRAHGAEIKAGRPARMTFAEYQLRKAAAPRAGAEEDEQR